MGRRWPLPEEAILLLASVSGGLQRSTRCPPSPARYLDVVSNAVDSQWTAKTRRLAVDGHLVNPSHSKWKISTPTRPGLLLPIFFLTPPEGMSRPIDKNVDVGGRRQTIAAQATSSSFTRRGRR